MPVGPDKELASWDAAGSKESMLVMFLVPDSSDAKGSPSVLWTGMFTGAAEVLIGSDFLVRRLQEW